MKIIVWYLSLLITIHVQISHFKYLYLFQPIKPLLSLQSDLIRFLFASVDEDVEGDGDGDGDEDGDAKAEYVKKEYFARPYESTSGMLDEVQNSIVQNSRPLM